MKKLMKGLIAFAFISAIGLTGFARSAFAAAPKLPDAAQNYAISAVSNKARDRDNIQDSTSPDRGNQQARGGRDDGGRDRGHDRGHDDRGRDRGHDRGRDDGGRDRGGVGRSGHDDGGRGDRGDSRR